MGTGLAVAAVLSLVSVSLGSGSIEVSVWSEGFFDELRRVSPICRSLGPTNHAGGIIEHFKKFNVYLILRLND